ncbi:glycosyltransferase [Roseixanthobacter pseudopolyaromaticivorans]|uniref:glycosyltransferase n=1 Tax=Xanthobacteraceae TaxID=335928 RepID=UPI003729CDAD
MSIVGKIETIDANAITGFIRLEQNLCVVRNLFIVVDKFPFPLRPEHMFASGEDGGARLEFAVSTAEILRAGFSNVEVGWSREEKIVALTFNLQVLDARAVRTFDVEISARAEKGWCTLQATTDMQVSRVLIEVEINGVFYLDFVLDTRKPTSGDTSPRAICCFPLPFSAQETETFDLAVFQTNGLVRSLRFDATLDASMAQDAERLSRQYYPPAYRSERPVAILARVGGGLESVCACVISVLTHTEANARLVLVQDGRLDPSAASYLEQLSRSDRVIFIKDDPGRVFRANAVNAALNMVPGEDIVLLKSDVLVGPGWLSGLATAVYSEGNIATATALSNAGGLFDLPIATPLETRLRDGLCRSVTQRSLSLFPATPVAQGPCVYIRRSALEDVEIHDVESLSIDGTAQIALCLKASKLGWRHVVDDRTLVLRSLSADRLDRKLGSGALPGANALFSVFPELESLIESIRANQALAMARFRAEGAHVSAKMRVLSVISTDTGGTPQTNRDLQRGVARDVEMLVLRSDGQMLTLTDPSGALIRSHRLLEPMTLGSHVSAEYNQILQRWLIEFAIELLHIRHIAWHSLSLPWIARTLHIPVIYSFHDYYSVCPSLRLLDGNNIYCGGVCTQSETACTPDLWDMAHSPPLKHRFVRTWKEMMENTLLACDAFVTTSQAARDLMRSHYPLLKDRPFNVIPHGRDLVMTELVDVFPPAPGTPLRLIAPGNISPAKGSDVLLQIQELRPVDEMEIHVVGASVAEVQNSALITSGPYTREDFPEIVARIRPHIGLVLSIWPETYSHTLTELWSCGVPVIAFDRGAVGERIRESGGGWLLPQDAGAEDICALIAHLERRPDEYEARRIEIEHWQSGTGTERDVAAMADDYLSLYRQIMFHKSLASHFPSPLG